MIFMIMLKTNFMKKMFVTRATWVLLISGSVMFGACKDNSSSSTAQNTDTPANVSPLYGNQNNGSSPVNGTANVPNTGTAANDNTAATGTNTSGSNGCAVVTRHKHAGRHKSARRTAEITTKTEENVAAAE